MKVTLDDVQHARKELSQYLQPTPVLFNSWLTGQLGCEVYFKLENMHPIGSFKIRGATYRISRLTDDEKKRGVVAASAGNHAQGVAWGSRKLGTDALIVMPVGAPLLKVKNTESLGATVRLEGETYNEAYQASKKICEETGRIFVHAYEDPDVIAGQGTAALELIEQLPDLDYVFTSMGGGGLAAGMGIVYKALKPRVKLVGCQASGANTLVRAIKEDSYEALQKVNTFADGIAVKKASQEMIDLIRSSIDELYTVDDTDIAAAVLSLMEKAKVVAEGAGAVPLAVLERNRERFRGKKVCVVVSGGNIDVNVLSRIIDSGLIRRGRRLRTSVLISDRPGSLSELTGLIADQGASIIQAIHDRGQPSARIDETEVTLTLETRGRTHSEAVVDALRSKVLELKNL